MGADGRGGNSGAVREVVIPYKPRAVWLPYHHSAARWRVVVAHRRAGKTVAALNGLIRTALTCQRPNPRCAYVAPYLGQAKAVAWDHLKRFTAPIPGVSWKEAELSCDLPNGGRIRLFGADNPDALRGLYLDDVDCDEFGDWDPRAWTEVIRPALSDRHGRATFTGTPRGKNAFYDLRERAARGEPGWALWELKASQTELLSDEELADARSAMDASAYAREYECSFDASVEGAYYAAEIAAADAAGRVCRVPIEPLAKVDTWWDLGIDETAHTMRPIMEYGRAAYFTRMYDPEGLRPAVAAQLGNTEAGDGCRFCGRGYVQLTGRANYARAGLVDDPDRALQPTVAAEVLERGMREGWFGRRLMDVLPLGGQATRRQFIAARRAVNGQDRAALIADYALRFQDALLAGGCA